MKKLLIVFLILPFFSFGQTSKWRNPTTTKSNTSSSELNTKTESSWRTNPPRKNQHSPTKYEGPVVWKSGGTTTPFYWYNTNPFYGTLNTWDPYWNTNTLNWRYNRWLRWGAPSQNYFDYWDYNYFSPQGYRQPARVYIWEDGKTDTIIGKKPIINIGFLFSTNKQLGGFFAVGRKLYFTMDFHSTYLPDRSTYFPNGTVDQIDFPLIEDLIKERTFYFGMGKRTERIGIHCLIGFGSEEIFWRGKDAVGEITFPKSEGKFTTLKIGTMYDIKNFTFKFDMDPIREFVQFGGGINF